MVNNLLGTCIKGKMGNCYKQALWMIDMKSPRTIQIYLLVMISTKIQTLHWDEIFDVTAGPHIYSRASQTEQRSARWASRYSRATWASNFRFFRVIQYRLITDHRRLCRVKNMLAMYLIYHKAGLTPTTPVTSIAISPVKMLIGRKSLTNLSSEMIFLQGKPVFYIFLPSTPPYWQIILRLCWQWTPKWQQSESRSRATHFRLSVVLGIYHI